MTTRTIITRMKRKVAFPMAALLLFLSGLGFVYGFINEAISLALEAATPYVEQGFEVREDNWSGEVAPDKPLLIQHQLFRGNEYWFWAGTSWPGATVKVNVFDKKGMAVGLETFSKEGKAGVRVLPSKTGTYFVRVTVSLKKTGKKDPATEKKTAAKDPETKKPASEKNSGDVIIISEGPEIPESLDWGLVYGYR